MNKKTTFWVIIGIILVLIIYVWSGYNSLVSLDERVKAAWGNVQNDYQRRSDLIPNLVNTVKGAANFEQKTLTDVIEARAKATSITVDPTKLNAEKISQFQKAQGDLSTALGRLLVVSENYPQLRATDAFRDLQVQLEGTENRIKVSRNDFNNVVKEYNSKARKFPSNILAKMFDFDAKPYFEADATAQKAPEVKF